MSRLAGGHWRRESGASLSQLRMNDRVASGLAGLRAKSLSGCPRTIHVNVASMADRRPMQRSVADPEQPVETNGSRDTSAHQSDVWSHASPSSRAGHHACEDPVYPSAPNELSAYAIMRSLADHR
jgi:hypothetical protein